MTFEEQTANWTPEQWSNFQKMTQATEQQQAGLLQQQQQDTYNSWSPEQQQNFANLVAYNTPQTPEDGLNRGMNLMGTSLTTPYGENTGNYNQEFVSWTNPHGGQHFIGTRADGTKEMVSREQAMQMGFVPHDYAPLPTFEQFQQGITPDVITGQQLWDQAAAGWAPPELPPGLMQPQDPQAPVEQPQEVEYVRPESQDASSYDPVGRAASGNWEPTQFDNDVTSQYRMDYSTQRLRDTRDYADDRMGSINEFSQWFTDINHVRRQDPDAFQKWVAENPEDAIRFHALLAQPSWNGQAGQNGDMSYEDAQNIADALAYQHSINLGYGEDGTKDGKRIASDFDTFEDLTSEQGPGDIWKLGEANSLPGGVNDWVENNPLKTVALIASTVLAPYAAGALAPTLGAAGAAGVVGAGTGALQSGLMGGDTSDILTAGLLGGAGNWLGQTATGGLGFGGGELGGIPKPDAIDNLVNVGKGLGDVGQAINSDDPDSISTGGELQRPPEDEMTGPWIGNTPVGTQPGWHWERDEDSVSGWKAVKDDPNDAGGGGGAAPVGGGGVIGGPGSPAPGDTVAPNTEGQNKETETWKHQNPDGTWVGGDETGDVWVTDPPPDAGAPTETVVLPLPLPPGDVWENPSTSPSDDPFPDTTEGESPDFGPYPPAPPTTTPPSNGTGGDTGTGGTGGGDGNDGTGDGDGGDGDGDGDGSGDYPIAAGLMAAGGSFQPMKNPLIEYNYKRLQIPQLIHLAQMLAGR